MYNKHQLAVSCTGAVISHIAGKGGPDGTRVSQLELAFPKIRTVGWATLSIGGNDANFGDIAYGCLAKWSSDTGPCDTLLQAAETKLTDVLFKHRLSSLYRLILDTHPNPDFLLVITGYARFFDLEHPKPCEDTHFLWGNKITVDLRTKLNLLVQHMNQVIRDAIYDANQADGTDKKNSFSRLGCNL